MALACVPVRGIGAPHESALREQSHYGENVGAVREPPDRARHPAAAANAALAEEAAAPLHFNGAAPVFSFYGPPRTKQSEVFPVRSLTFTENDIALPAERGNLEYAGLALVYEGNRVKSALLGRDLNPMGRGDGNFYPAGALQVADAQPAHLGDWFIFFGSGNSANNGGDGIISSHGGGQVPIDQQALTERCKSLRKRGICFCGGRACLATAKLENYPIIPHCFSGTVYCDGQALCEDDECCNPKYWCNGLPNCQWCYPELGGAQTCECDLNWHTPPHPQVVPVNCTADQTAYLNVALTLICSRLSLPAEYPSRCLYVDSVLCCLKEICLGRSLRRPHNQRPVKICCFDYMSATTEQRRAWLPPGYAPTIFWRRKVLGRGKWDSCDMAINTLLLDDVANFEALAEWRLEYTIFHELIHVCRELREEEKYGAYGRTERCFPGSYYDLKGEQPPGDWLQ